jgi:energy-coupling factor transporter ATP-binding protein EcfA2
MMLYYYMLFIIYLHLVGCMWFFVIEQTYKLSLEDSRYQPWIPPYDYYDGADPFWERYRNEERFFIYWVCLYYSVLVIGGNEMGPKELSELVFMVMINLTGAIFQAYIFGELAVLIAQVGTKEKSKQEEIDNANMAMKNVNLPEPLKNEIREFYKGTQDTKMRQ